jgi:hypothetical protein
MRPLTESLWKTSSMSNPPIRRNPARTARVPRRADVPVSFALAPISDSDDDSDSDIEVIPALLAADGDQVPYHTGQGEHSTDSEGKHYLGKPSTTLTGI